MKISIHFTWAHKYNMNDAKLGISLGTCNVNLNYHVSTAILMPLKLLGDILLNAIGHFWKSNYCVLY